MRRHLMLALLAGLGSSATLAQTAPSATPAWPDKPVRIVVPYAAGGTTDFAARQVAQKLGEILGGSFFVENKAGGAGTIGTAQVAKAAPDGSTWLTNDTTYAMLPAVFARLPWDHAKDLQPVTTLLHAPVVAVVPANSPFKTLQELLAHARSKPGQLNYGSGGSGSSTHLQAELFKSVNKVSITHIPYKGAGDAMLGLISGQVDLLITATPTAIPQLKGDKARALAVTGAQRSPAMPEVPTFAEAGVQGYAIDNWFGLAAPRGTDPRIVARMQQAVARAMSDPALKARYAEQGALPGGMATADFAEMIVRQTKLWTGAAAAAGLKPE